MMKSVEVNRLQPHVGCRIRTTYGQRRYMIDFVAGWKPSFTEPLPHPRRSVWMIGKRPQVCCPCCLATNRPSDNSVGLSVGLPRCRRLSPAAELTNRACLELIPRSELRSS